MLSLALMMGCAQDESPLSREEPIPPGSVFSGITERDEWGDTLSVDSTDWVIVGGPLNSFRGSLVLPFFRDGKRLPGSQSVMSTNQLEYSIGAFPNPFIPGTGRVLIEFVLPETAYVAIHARNEAGSMDLTLMDAELPLGIHLLAWEGLDASGDVLPDGFYRIYYQAGPVTSYGDVQMQLSGYPEPAQNADYVLFAQENWDMSEYVDYEYQIATTFGWDGEPGGLNVYDLPQFVWENLDYPTRFWYLPVFMNYDITSADGYQYHYLLAYKHFQFGAGWPDDGDSGTIDPTDPRWQLTNAYHDIYVDLFEQGP